MLEPERWYPVAASHDLPEGHVYQTRLGGNPLAIWRASDGRVNIWEDRCPHRGVRFSIGIAAGDELICQYHAWRFASGSGACTHIPAQPDRKPAAAIRATIWPVLEQGGLIWTGIAPEGCPTVGNGEVLRAIAVNAPAAEAEAALPKIDAVHFFVQPVEAQRCVIRGIAPATADIRALDAEMEALRRSLELVPC